MERIYPILLLAAANIFMCFAWYWHLKIEDKPIFLIILMSWGIAFFEYTIQVPANRLGYRFYTVGQLKVMQEVITMIVFAFFSVFYMKEKLTLDFLFAGLCLVGAVFFMFRHAF